MARSRKPSLGQLPMLELEDPTPSADPVDFDWHQPFDPDGCLHCWFQRLHYQQGQQIITLEEAEKRVAKVFSYRQRHKHITLAFYRLQSGVRQHWAKEKTVKDLIRGLQLNPQQAYELEALIDSNYRSYLRSKDHSNRQVIARCRYPRHLYHLGVGMVETEIEEIDDAEKFDHYLNVA